MITFKQFIEADMGQVPTMGAPTDPADNPKSNDDLNVLGRELDIEPDVLDKALQGTPILSFSPINRKGHNKGSGAQVILPDRVNRSGSVTGRLMQGNMPKLRNPNGSKSDGPAIEPIHFRRTNQPNAGYTFSNVWLEPFAKQQQQQGGGMGGGAMPMGGPAGAIPPPPGGF